LGLTFESLKELGARQLATISTRVVKKIAKLCHIAKNKLLAKQLPLSQKEITSPSPVGSSFPIINWSIPMHQTNVATSSSLTLNVIVELTTVTKTQQQE
jgi:hypothetical protein